MIFSSVTLKTRTLSAIILIVDDYRVPDAFTEMEPYTKKDCTVVLNKSQANLLQNQSGLYYAVNLPDGQYNATISAKNFIDQQTNIDVSGIASKPATIRLKPAYDYYFPDGVTFIRGSLIDNADSTPIVAAKITVTGKTETTYSDSQGRFMMYFKPGIISTTGETITLSITHSLYTTKAHSQTNVKENNRTTLSTALVMQKNI